MNLIVFALAFAMAFAATVARADAFPADAPLQNALGEPMVTDKTPLLDAEEVMVCTTKSGREVKGGLWMDDGTAQYQATKLRQCREAPPTPEAPLGMLALVLGAAAAGLLGGYLLFAARNDAARGP